MSPPQFRFVPGADGNAGTFSDQPPRKRQAQPAASPGDQHDAVHQIDPAAGPDNSACSGPRRQGNGTAENYFSQNLRQCELRVMGSEEERGAQQVPSIVTADELVEVALLTIGRLFLEDQGQPALLELFEKLLPPDFLQVVVL